MLNSTTSLHYSFTGWRCACPMQRGALNLSFCKPPRAQSRAEPSQPTLLALPASSHLVRPAAVSLHAHTSEPLPMQPSASMPPPLYTFVNLSQPRSHLVNPCIRPLPVSPGRGKGPLLRAVSVYTFTTALAAGHCLPGCAWHAPTSQRLQMCLASTNPPWAGMMAHFM